MTGYCQSAIIVAYLEAQIRTSQVNCSMSLGEYIKTVRHSRGLSQWELARLSGLTRSHLSRLELDDFENPSAETFLALAKALKIHPNDLYQAAGYIDENARFKRSLAKTPEEIFDDIEKIDYSNIPVVEDSEAGMPEIRQYSHWAYPVGDTSKLIGILADEFSFPPEIRLGDVVFINTEALPGPGKLVLCFKDERIQIIRLPKSRKKLAGAAAKIFGVIVGINRKFD